MVKFDYTMMNTALSSTFAAADGYGTDDQLTPAKFKKLREDILNLLASEPGMYPQEIAERLGHSHLLISEITSDMSDEGLIGVVGGA